MDELKQIFGRLWIDYCKKSPSAKKIKMSLIQCGNFVINDHVAIRTFDLPQVNIETIATPFINSGYKEKASYEFKEKKLIAKHFEHKDFKDAPKVFISQLKTNECSQFLQDFIHKLIGDIMKYKLNPDYLIYQGRLWDELSYKTYKKVLKESEYAAWLYINGFCANHFTISVNHLRSIQTLEQMNIFLKNQNYKLNKSGGEIKGSPEIFLEQSSIMADKIPIKFIEGEKEVPSCYYEFAYRYNLPNGELFNGFVVDSADKIFESTDNK